MMIISRPSSKYVLILIGFVVFIEIIVVKHFSTFLTLKLFHVLANWPRNALRTPLMLNIALLAWEGWLAMLCMLKVANHNARKLPSVQSRYRSTCSKVFTHKGI